MTTRPPFVTVVCFDKGPVVAFADDEQTRDFLADVLQEHAELYRIWSGYEPGSMLKDITAEFVEAWAACFEFAEGDEPDEFLRNYPEFVRAFIGDKLIAAYRAAQEAA